MQPSAEPPVLRQWVIYDHPRDFPQSWVMREWLVGKGTLTIGRHFIGPTLESVREHVPPGAYNLGRAEHDDPTIYEVWT